MTLRAGARSALGGISLLGATLALLLAAGELCVRLAPVWSGGVADSRFNPYRPDGRTGFSLRPATDVVQSEQEFRVAVHVNALGLRGPERSLEKPLGVARILVLGDSFAFGFGVGEDETFSAQLEQLLAAEGLRVEVLSAGVPGWSLDNELVYLRNEGFRLEPDLILVATCENDLSDLAWNRLTLDEERLPIRVEAMLRMIDPEGRMHFVNQGRYALPGNDFPGKHWLEDHSRLYHWLRLRLAKLSVALSVRAQRPAPPQWLAEDPPRPVESLTQEQIQLGLASSPEFELRYHRYLAAALERAANARGIAVRTLLVSARASGRLPGTAIGALHDDCESRPGSCLDADDVFLRDGNRDQYFYPIDGHWNAAGHRRVAKALAQLLKDGPALRRAAAPPAEAGTAVSLEPGIKAQP